MHATKSAFALSAFAPVLLLAACSTPEGEFPSLERRPYESDNPLGIPENAAPAVTVVLPAELASQVSALTARHKAAHTLFERDVKAAAQIAARAAGSTPGSEAWVNAHLQLSRVDKTRADSIAALREFDALIAEQGDRDSTYVPLLTESQKSIADEVAAQNAEIGRLSRLIGE